MVLFSSPPNLLYGPPRVFVSNVPSVFFFEFSTPSSKHKNALIYLIQTIVYAIWKFQNRATFHNGHDDHRAIIKYVLQDVKFRLHCDFASLPRTCFILVGFSLAFARLWVID